MPHTDDLVFCIVCTHYDYEQTMSFVSRENLTYEEAVKIYETSIAKKGRKAWWEDGDLYIAVQRPEYF